jgi:hypothetical protein
MVIYHLPIFIGCAYLYDQSLYKDMAPLNEDLGTLHQLFW